MQAQRQLYAGHCRAKNCTALAQCFVAYNYISGRQGHTRIARKVMCRAHAEATVAKHAAPALENI